VDLSHARGWQSTVRVKPTDGALTGTRCSCLAGLPHFEMMGGFRHDALAPQLPVTNEAAFALMTHRLKGWW